MDISAYQLIEQLETMPKEGLIEFSLKGGEIYIEARWAHYEALSEQTIVIKGRSGFGTITTCESILLFDVDQIDYLRHTLKERA